ncbi:MAG: hypothetical protein OXT67_08200 [Zetaproteobacteria bacterium]|nr:hypothetical protein [Zetaproteobacteria bacterium]
MMGKMRSVVVFSFFVSLRASAFTAPLMLPISQQVVLTQNTRSAPGLHKRIDTPVVAPKSLPQAYGAEQAGRRGQPLSMDAGKTYTTEYTLESVQVTSSPVPGTSSQSVVLNMLVRDPAGAAKVVQPTGRVHSFYLYAWGSISCSTVELRVQDNALYLVKLCSGNCIEGRLLPEKILLAELDRQGYVTTPDFLDARAYVKSYRYNCFDKLRNLLMWGVHTQNQDYFSLEIPYTDPAGNAWKFVLSSALLE